MPYGPPVSVIYGGLADEAFTDGTPVTAHLARELARQSNRLLVNGGLVYRYVGNAEPATNSTADQLRATTTWGPIFHQHMTPVIVAPVKKKPGIVELRIRIRAMIATGAVVRVTARTSVGPVSASITGVGTTTSVVATLLAPCRKGPGEALAFYWNWRNDVDNDPLMDFGAHGGTAATGTITQADQTWFNDSTLADWTGAAPVGFKTTPVNVASAGHYAVLRDNSGEIAHIAEIRTVGRPDQAGRASSLVVWPPIATPERLRNGTYEIRERPSLQLNSIAVYGVDRELS